MGSEDADDTALRRQDVLAEFGELALESDDLDEILAEACRLVGKALGTDLAKVMELQSDGLTLLVRAGVGWKPGVVGVVTVKAEEGSSEGHALQTGAPVTSDDIDQEERFTYADFIKDNGVKALVNVAIGGKNGQPFGILQVDSRTPRSFGRADIGFLRGYANLLGAAVYRIKVAEDLRVTQDNLRQRDEMLGQSAKLEAIGQLTGGVAHDFNNLLTIIGSSVDLLRRPDVPEARRTRYIDAIAETVARASKLTGQLLAFARRQTLKPVTFDVGEQVRGIANLLSPLLGSRISVDLGLCDPPCFAQADIGQFDTAIVNLAINARDAMDGEGSLRIGITLADGIPAIRGHVSVSGAFVAVSVSDTGPGIEPSQLGKIFEPFFTTKEVGKGTGLGLSQVIGFAKQSHGEVVVDSAPGQGSTFTLFIPECAPADVGPPSAPKTGRRSVRGDGVCILVVEDNESVGRFATEMLHDLGYRTAWAGTASEALAKLETSAQDFDLVFSDVVMPGMNGITFGETVRSLYPALPVVLTSGYSNVLAEEGAHGFELIAKPYSIEALSLVIQKLVRDPDGQADH